MPFISYSKSQGQSLKLKAVRKVKWRSFKYCWKPQNVFYLLGRKFQVNGEGFIKSKIHSFCSNDSATANTEYIDSKSKWGQMLTSGEYWWGIYEFLLHNFCHFSIKTKTLRVVHIGLCGQVGGHYLPILALVFRTLSIASQYKKAYLCIAGKHRMDVWRTSKIQLHFFPFAVQLYSFMLKSFIEVNNSLSKGNSGLQFY